MSTENDPTKWLVCDDCGQKKADVHETVCPYIRELEDRDEPATLCDWCYRERADAV